MLQAVQQKSFSFSNLFLTVYFNWLILCHFVLLAQLVQ